MIAFTVHHSVLVSVCVATIAMSAGANDGLKRYDHHKVVSVQIESPLDVAFIDDIGGDIWSHQPVDGAIDVRFAPNAMAALRDSGLKFQTKIDNVQDLVDAERDSQRAAAQRGAGFFEYYHRYGEIMDYLEQLVADYPTLASMFDVGTTVQGRTIRGIRIAGPNVTEFNPAVIYFGTVHAREWIATTINSYVATELLANYGTDPQITELVDRVEWLLIPVANPDGFEYTLTTERFWRKNRRNLGDGEFGVDINRNWGWAWGGIGSSGTTTSEIYRGPYPFSEPETSALRDLFLIHPNTRAQLDIHSYGQLILWPWGHTPIVSPDEASYQAIGAAMQQEILDVHNRFYNRGPIYTGIYPVSGDSLDWTYGERRIWSLSFELRGGGFVLPPEEIIPNNEEIFPAILHLTGTNEVLSTQINLLTPPANVMTMGQPLFVAAAVTSGVEAIDPSMAQLHYRYDTSGPFKTIAMQHVGNAQFNAELPPTNCSSTPEYFLSITTESGIYTVPKSAPNNVYHLSMQHWSNALPDWTGPNYPCVTFFGDYDGDTEVTLTDFAAFSDCMEGPTGALQPECGIFDAEPDGDVDLWDLMQMQRAQS